MKDLEQVHLEDMMEYELPMQYQLYSMLFNNQVNIESQNVNKIQIYLVLDSGFYNNLFDQFLAF